MNSFHLRTACLTLSTLISLWQDATFTVLSVAVFPSSSFYVHFEVLHQKRVMATPNLKNKSLNLQKSFYAHLRWFLTCAKKAFNANIWRWKRI